MNDKSPEIVGSSDPDDAPAERAGDIRTGSPAARPTGEPAVLRVTARVLSLVAGVGILAMMLVTVVDVARRKAGMGSIAGALEATEVALVAVVFASMMSAESTGTHVRTAIVTARLKPRVATIARLIGFVIVIVFLLWVTYWTWDAAVESMEKGERRFGGNEVPVWPAKFFIPIGFGGMALEYISHAVAAIRSLKSGQIVIEHAAVEPGSLL